VNEWDYVFSENGLVAYKEGQLIAKQSLVDYLGEKNLQKFINFALRYIADLDIPVKRYTRHTRHHTSPPDTHLNQAVNYSYCCLLA